MTSPAMKKPTIFTGPTVNQTNKKSMDSHASRKSQSGVGLIEVLIAVVVMSVGFLAAARMQVEGMRFSQSAYYQSQAHFLANDMIDRMRSNIQGVLDGEYNNKSTSSSAVKPGCVDCTPAEVALLDLFDWSASLHPIAGTAGFIPALQGGTSPAQGRIIAMGGEQFAIEMTWTEVIAGADTTQRLRIQFELETRGI